MSQSRLQNDKLVRYLAQGINHRNLGPIALLALEVGRPLALLAAQLVWLAQPALTLVLEPRQLTRLAQLLEEPGSIDILITYLNAEE